MCEVFRTDEFVRWFDRLRDRRAAARIAIRLDRLAEGNAGDVKPVGQGISELRITYGPGYRVYYTERGGQTLLLLIGGDKSSQDRDIAKAKKLAQTWKAGQ